MRLRIEEYSPWISGELDKTLRPTRSKAAKLVDDASRSLADARDYYEGLARKGEHDMATKKDAASYRAARVIGHAAQEAAGLLKQIQTPDSVGWESLKVLKDSLSSASRSIRNMRDSASRELSGFYLLDQRAFGIVIDRVAKSSERLSAFLDGEGANLERARTMSGIIDGINAAMGELKEQTSERDRLNDELRQAHAKVLELTGKVDQLSSGRDLREVLEIERELRRESRVFRSETLAHLQRPLRRLGDLSQRGEFAMGSDEREALARFTVSPYKTFLSKLYGDRVEAVLGDMKRAIEAGKLEFKPKKTGRVSSQLSQLVGTGRLGEMQRKGRGLVARRREL
ncbi:MAG TPA: hypothetical protein VFV92_02365, partial [Candidatus Bathyarchaeia archaeon]|nr:hypothetical protein [Candidatus Bathyarchaeia archaeon]